MLKKFFKGNSEQRNRISEYGLLVEWIEKIVEGISGVDKENSGGD